MIVLDASVAVKWFRDEDNSDLAEALLMENRGELVVPDLFVIEVAGALVREANMNKPVAAEMRLALSRLVEMIDAGAFESIRLDPDRLATAAALAIALGHPLKDCLYLALAQDLACPLVTADARFAERARGVYSGVRVLGDGA